DHAAGKGNSAAYTMIPGTGPDLTEAHRLCDRLIYASNCMPPNGSASRQFNVVIRIGGAPDADSARLRVVNSVLAYAEHPDLVCQARDHRPSGDERPSTASGVVSEAVAVAL